MKKLKDQVKALTTGPLHIICCASGARVPVEVAATQADLFEGQAFLLVRLTNRRKPGARDWWWAPAGDVKRG
jgi:hypothetical protein